jgi:uncharacterized membrane protein HdeD (DUF308 family)
MAEMNVASSCSSGWGALVLLGILSLIFGIVMMFFPGITAMAVITLIGIIIIVLGIIAVIMALFTPAGEGKSTLLLLVGIIGVLVGAGAIIYPIVFGEILTEIIGIVVFIIGIIQIAFALAEKGVTSRGLLMLSGIISIIFSVLIMAYPLIGALVLFGYLIAIYFFITGLVTIVTGFVARSAACAERA